jgi:CheY-like chemotaxis protein
MMLDKFECRTTIASNGQQALEALCAESFDLVLMDCQMPVMDGFEATGDIRRAERTMKHTTIVAMTANALQGERERCIAAGMDDYISKPVMLEDLEGVLRRWCADPNRRKPAERAAPTPRPVEMSLDRKRLDHLLQLSKKQGTSMFGRLIHAFLEDAPARIATMRTALAAGDTETLFTAAHSLKGISGNIGAMALMSIAQELQVRGHNKSLEGAAELIESVEEEMRRVRSVLESEYLSVEAQR